MGALLDIWRIARDKTGILKIKKFIEMLPDNIPHNASDIMKYVKSIGSKTGLTADRLGMIISMPMETLSDQCAVSIAAIRELESIGADALDINQIQDLIGKTRKSPLAAGSFRTLINQVLSRYAITKELDNRDNSIISRHLTGRKI